jgi:hypothetical protein
MTLLPTDLGEIEDAADVVGGGDIDPTTARLLSVGQLQQVLRTARREHLTPASPSVLEPLSAPNPARLPTLVTRASLPAGWGDNGVRAVVVLAAHSGAGASTVALAIADASASAGRHVLLVECAAPARSGLAAATSSELGLDGGGWRRGRRGDRIEIRRLASRVASIDDVPPPPPLGGDEADGQFVIVDAGWPVHDVLGAEGWIRGLVDVALPVIVCRATVRGVQQAEQVLAALSCPVLVAATGPTRWTRTVTASCGLGLREARRSGHLVSVPVDRHLDVAGLTADPLPKLILAAGRRLAALVPAEPPLASRAGNLQEEHASVY